MNQEIVLDVPALSCVIEDRPRVFDAWGWCPSDVLVWRRPKGASGPLSKTAAMSGANPPGLAFVVREERRATCAFLPRELARLHVFGYGLEDEEALAPWAIDDATDLLFEHGRRPADVFWVAASTLEALVWGLHDWVHFHNHGPFVEPAMTELQCDLVALSWLRRNASRIGLASAEERLVATELAELSRRRFADEGIALDLDLDELFRGDYPSRPLFPMAQTEA